MERGNFMKKASSVDICAQSTVITSVLGVLFWLFPLLSKGWLLSISTETFYAKYTAVFMICAAWPIIDSVIVLYRTKKNEERSLSRRMKVNILMIVAINTFALLFVVVANAVIEARNDMLSDIYQQLGGFIYRYGGIYVVAMLLSMLLGIAAIRRAKKGAGKVTDVGE